ncbi:MAG: Hpt domain-containing protein [Myxococcota bacterium]
MTTELDPKRREALQKMQDLRARFSGRLRERVLQLRESLEATAAEESGALARAESLAHRLSGTAGSYGFPEVSRLAGELELVLRGASFNATQARALMRELETHVELKSA